jgi:hypothetical protein
MSTIPAPPPRHALGWPAGSIRAILALGVLGYLWLLALTPAQEDGRAVFPKQASQAFVYLQLLMVLILAHFFVAHGKTIGHHVSMGSPLGMPRGSVRLLLLGGYLGLAYYMYHTKPEFQVPDTAPILVMLAVLLTAFLIGHWITSFMYRVSGGVLPAWFQDIQAWFALIGLLLLGIIVLFRLVINKSVPLESQIDLNTMETALAAVVGFYVGARS